MKNMNPPTSKKSERGQSLVELAFVIVIMLILLAGIVDLGRMIFEYMSMRDAAQEGASYASMYPSFCDQVEDRVYSNLFNTDSGDVQVAIAIDGVECRAATTANACAPNSVQVTVTQPAYRLTMPFIGVFLGRQTVSLEADITETILRPACSP